MGKTVIKMILKLIQLIIGDVITAIISISIFCAQLIAARVILDWAISFPVGTFSLCFFIWLNKSQTGLRLYYRR